MSIGLPFSPIATVSTATSGTAARIELSRNASAMSVRLLVVGAGLAAFRLGGSDVEAVVTDTPIAAAAPEIFNKGGATHLSVIAITGTPTVYATSGIGGS